jgi:hypothetical protein
LYGVEINRVWFRNSSSCHFELLSEANADALAIYSQYRGADMRISLCSIENAVWD